MYPRRSKRGSGNPRVGASDGRSRRACLTVRSICGCLTVGMVFVAADRAGVASELFPYNPPTMATPQMQQQRAQPAARLSDEELSRIEKLANDIARLSSDQRKDVRGKIQQELDKAVSRSDLPQIRYYNELLRRVDNMQ